MKSQDFYGFGLVQKEVKNNLGLVD